MPDITDSQPSAAWLRLPVMGLLATALTVTGCGAATGSHPAAAPSTGQASATGSAPIPATAARTGATTPIGSPSPQQARFTGALAAWKSAAVAPAATMNTFLQQAADDLRTAGQSSYDAPISELTYLAHLPATNDTPAEQATARTDVQALDTFFGTPGLMN